MPHRPPIRRVVAFRLLAILLGIAPLLLGEAALRLAGWQPLDEVRDPYVGFAGIRPLFELNRGTGRYEIPVSRQALFCAESFVADKPSDGFRIFCLGGSTVQGRPYARQTSFTSWLQQSLRAAEPARFFEVVNCGGVSYASYRLVPIAREVLQYQPDLLILYTGHNEFLEERTYRGVRATPSFVVTAHAYLSSWRIYALLRSAWLALRQRDRPVLAEDADALLDYRGGLELYQRDDAGRATIIAHFGHSVSQVARLARQAGVPLIICNPATNLLDTRPFKSQWSVDARAERRLESLFADATNLPATERLAPLQGILGTDDRYASAWWLLGRARAERAEYELALDCLIRAKEEDVCPLRILEPMRRILAEVGREEAAGWVDIQALCAAESQGGLAGEPWLIDHVHPSISAHQQIAAALFDELVRLGLVAPRSGWQARREALYAEQRGTLPADYFRQAEERRQGLRRWTEGRAFQVPP